MTLTPRIFYTAAILAVFLLGAHIDNEAATVDAAVAEEAAQAPSEAKRQARVERAMQIAEAAR